MQRIPPFLIPHLSRLKVTSRRLSVQEIQFSGPTYQVKIEEFGQDEVWSFIQLNQKTGIADAFCSCSESEENGGGCLHLALAYQNLFDGKGVALHESFRKSLWYALGKIWLKRGKQLRLNPVTEGGHRFLQLLQGEKIAETEENSIKFSNLSEKELEDWHEGNPSEELLFELSSFADLAKQLFLYGLKKKIYIHFKGAGDLPTQGVIESNDFDIKTRIELEDWHSLIPVLNTVPSSLTTFNELKDCCEEIDYDKEKKCFHLKPKRLMRVTQGIPIGNWIYKKEKGFYPSAHVFKEWICGAEIEPFLDRYKDELAAFIKNEEVVPLKYSLHFDENWDLHLDPYAFKKGDLKKAERWGKWTYISSKGFFPLFIEKEFPLVIAQTRVAEFIEKEAAWLKGHPGFMVHWGGIETQIIYWVDKQGALHFERRLPHQGAGTKEFDSWVYVEGEGFFNKVNAPVYLPIELGVPIKKHIVPSFIRRHVTELGQIPGFINTEEPFEEVGVEIGLDKKSRIWIEPRLVLKPKYKDHTVRFYEEWVYLEKEGFFELPSSQRLPEDLRSPLWISKENVRDFIENTWPAIDVWVKKVDPKLIPPAWIRLVLDHLEEGPYHSWILEFHYQTDHGKIPIKKVIDAIRRKEKYLFLAEGCLDLSEDRFLWIKRLKNEAIGEDYRLNLSLIELIRLHAFEEIGAVKSVSELFQEVIDLKKTPSFDIASLKSVLRPYQKIGAEWLFSLYNYLLGGLLCDEMGLGKTHQAMALIAAMGHINPEAKSIVICPTSVLYHWEDKLAEFFPSLKVFIHHGTFRKKEIKGDFNLFLTSYGVLRRDIDWLKRYSFDLAFFDEIQVAKNHRSKLYYALQQLKVEVKIGLTGTPLENRLRELKTLFDLVLPGYMPHEAEYNKLIVAPIEKKHDMMKKGLLQRLTHPFILRRRKIDVLRDLPEKTEAVAHCELTPEQDRLYRETLFAQGTELLQDLRDVKRAVPFVHIFSLLSRLKQICDHPALYLKKTEVFDEYRSGKWDLFVELLQEARESQQKVVVYSQYLGMLDIIENYLTSKGIGFASLRGSTRDRKEQIHLFAQDPTCEVFVASLKAAGLGIDLTAASVVIHYDRWWNAARENQATDRVHRFGQSRGVQVFKLVTKNTFEERIDQIIERKKYLMEEAIGFDDQTVMKSFTRDELFELLQHRLSE